MIAAAAMATSSVTMVGNSLRIRSRDHPAITRAGSKLKPRETYDTSYVPFCKERGLEPVSFTRFGMVVKAAAAEGAAARLSPKALRQCWAKLAEERTKLQTGLQADRDVPTKRTGKAV